MSNLITAECPVLVYEEEGDLRVHADIDADDLEDLLCEYYGSVSTLRSVIDQRVQSAFRSRYDPADYSPESGEVLAAHAEIEFRGEPEYDDDNEAFYGFNVIGVEPADS